MTPDVDEANDTEKRIVANADRLLADAKLLRSHGRFHSATALAIFALEEMGKWSLFRTKESNGGRPLNRIHLEKQASFGAAYAANIIVKGFRDAATRHGVPTSVDARVAYAKYLLDKIASGEIKSTEELSELVKEQLMEAFEKQKALRFLDAARARQIEQLKHRCLYIDLNANDSRESLEPIDAQLCDEWINNADLYRFHINEVQQYQEMTPEEIYKAVIELNRSSDV